MWLFAQAVAAAPEVATAVKQQISDEVWKLLIVQFFGLATLVVGGIFNIWLTSMKQKIQEQQLKTLHTETVNQTATLANQDKTLAVQDEKLDSIQRKVNGGLTEVVKSAVADAMAQERQRS